MKRTPVGVIISCLVVLGTGACSDRLDPVSPALSLSAGAEAAGYDCTVQSQVPQAECEALLALYNQANGSGWPFKTNWLVTAPCSWWGITCGGGHVQAIRLGRNGLVGSLPAELQNLRELQVLNLGDRTVPQPNVANRLSGGIPSWLANLPRLQELSLWGSFLDGPIPASLGSLAELRVLQLDGNQLTGSIPGELGNLAALRVLRLGSNNLTGQIPAALGNLSALQILDLCDISLTGGITEELKQLLSLEELVLCYDNLSGGIPSWLGQLSHLRVLNLASNQLTGTVPSELGDLESLVYLNVSSNRLTGSLPPDLGRLTQLRSLAFASNDLSGPIPDEFGNLVSLWTLWGPHNRLEGPIPDLSRLVNLNSLSLDQNRLTGAIPPTLGALTGLYSLQLSRNLLSGPIPENIGRMPALRALELQGNRLSGPLPLTIAVRGEQDTPSYNRFWTCNVSNWYSATELFLPDEPSYRAADANGDSSICGVAFLANQPPMVNAGGSYAAIEGTAVGLDGTASDPNGDALTWSWTATPGPDADPGAWCTFTGGNTSAPAVACNDDGSYTLTAQVSDGTNPAATATAVLMVHNAPPLVGALTLPAEPVALGSQAVVSAPYTDAGGNDSHIATVQWDAGTAFEGASAAGGVASASRSNLPAGVYTVTLQVTDDDGGAGSQTSSGYVVVYDPAGSFVTGGGWIWSPVGAYPAEPGLEGRASFGFVSRYKPGAGVPSGNTEFQFKAGNLNFSSTSYQWLVVAGARAQYKGLGTINGTGSYAFLLTAIDGARAGGSGPDRFRVKIWDVASGVTVYDNRSGEAEDSDAATELGGGSITIHN